MTDKFIKTVFARLSIMLLAALVSSQAYADFEKGYFRYRQIDADSVEVVGVASDSINLKHINIGYDVEFEGKFYKIAGIASGAFDGLPELLTVNTNISDIRYIGSGAFRDCPKLLNVDITNKVSEIEGYTFAGCPSLTTVTFQGYIKSVGGHAFEGCTSLNSVVLSGTVSIGDYAFSDCTNLRSAILPWQLEEIGSCAFYNTAISEVSFKDRVKEIGSSAFADCRYLTSVKILGVETDPVDINPQAFDGSPITYVSLNRDLSGSLINPFGTQVQEVFMGEALTCVNDRLFEDCASLTKVTFGPSVREIGASAFARCTSLTDIDLPDGLELISSSAFHSCTGLTSVSIPASVTKIDGLVFEYCSNLTSFTLEDSGTPLEMHYLTLNGCPVTDFYMGRDFTCNHFGSIFEAELRSVVMGDMVTEVPDYAFHVRKGLASVTFGENVRRIGNNAFNGCESITGLSLGGNVEEIADNAFIGCAGLTAITIPGSVATIGAAAFRSCPAVVRIELGAGVREIGLWAFVDSQDVSEVVSANPVPPTVNDPFSDRTYAEATLIVPTGSRAAYMAAPYWEEFGTIVERDMSGLTHVGDGSRAAVTVIDGSLSFTADCAGVTVCDAGGRLVYRGAVKAGEKLELAPGNAYIVVMDGRTRKVVL